jgi:hypothetical protein
LEKIDEMGMGLRKIPNKLKMLPDDDIWWPRNTTAVMSHLARDAGWSVEMADLGCFQRDGVILLRKI